MHPIGIEPTTSTLPELLRDSAKSCMFLLYRSKRVRHFSANYSLAKYREQNQYRSDAGKIANRKFYKDSSTINGAMSSKVTAPSSLVSA